MTSASAPSPPPAFQFVLPKGPGARQVTFALPSASSSSSPTRRDDATPSPPAPPPVPPSPLPGALTVVTPAPRLVPVDAAAAAAAADVQSVVVQPAPRLPWTIVTQPGWSAHDLEAHVLALIGGAVRDVGRAHSHEAALWWRMHAWRFVPQQTVDAFTATRPPDSPPLTGFTRPAAEAVFEAAHALVPPPRDAVRLLRRIDGALRRSYAQIALGAKVRGIRVLGRLLDAAIATERTLGIKGPATAPARPPLPAAAATTTPCATKHRAPSPPSDGTAPWARDVLAAFAAGAPLPPPSSSSSSPATALKSTATAQLPPVPPLGPDDVSRAVMASRNALYDDVSPTTTGGADAVAIARAAIDAAVEVYLRDSDAAAACPLRLPVYACYATRVTAADVRAIFPGAPPEARAGVLHTASRHACAPPADVAPFAGPPLSAHLNAPGAPLDLVPTPPPPPPPSRFGPAASAAPGSAGTAAAATGTAKNAPATALDRFVVKRRRL